MRNSWPTWSSQRSASAEPGSTGLLEPLYPSAFPSAHEWLQALEWQYRAMVGGNGEGRVPGLTLRGKPLLAYTSREGDGRDTLFWHVVTSGCVGQPRRQRLLDPGRAARMGQAWRLLELFDAGDVRAVWWRETRRRVLVAPADFSLVVVLQERQNEFTLRTYIPASRPTQQRRLFRRAAESWEQGRSRREDPPGLPASGVARAFRPPASGRRWRLFPGARPAWDSVPA